MQRNSSDNSFLFTFNESKIAPTFVFIEKFSIYIAKYFIYEQSLAIFIYGSVCI